MNKGQYAVISLFLISLLAFELVSLSNQQSGTYNPWLDYNDDGIIDADDLQALGKGFGAQGDSITKASMEYDSGWIDLCDKHGQSVTVTHNLNLGSATTYSLDVDGRTVQDGAVHQRYFNGIGCEIGLNKTYGGTDWDFAYSIVQTTDEGYALAGYNQSYITEECDARLVRTNSAGIAQWNRTYRRGNQDVVYSMVQTSDGGYALAGYTTPYGASYCDFWLVKTDMAGNHLWNKTYGGAYSDQAFSVAQTSDGGYAMAGFTYSYGSGEADFWLVRTNSAGIAQWNRTYGGADSESCCSMVLTSDGGYAMAGLACSADPYSGDFWLVKTDASGNMQWNKTYGGPDWDEVHSVVCTDDGGYAVVGDTRSFDPDPYYTDYQAYLVKTYADGTIAWNRTYGGAGDDSARSVVQTDDGGYALAGYTYSAGSQEFWLVKTDSVGNAQWNRAYGGAGANGVCSLVQTSDGGYALAGSTYWSDVGGFDFQLLKTDAHGLIAIELGLAIVDYTANTLTLYRGKNDFYWNYVRVRIWVIKENP